MENRSISPSEENGNVNGNGHGPAHRLYVPPPSASAPIDLTKVDRAFLDHIHSHTHGPIVRLLAAEVERQAKEVDRLTAELEMQTRLATRLRERVGELWQRDESEEGEEETRI